MLVVAELVMIIVLLIIVLLLQVVLVPAVIVGMLDVEQSTLQITFPSLTSSSLSFVILFCPSHQDGGQKQEQQKQKKELHVKKKCAVFAHIISFWSHYQLIGADTDQLFAKHKHFCKQRNPKY